MPTRRQLEDELIACSHRLHQNGWVANHDGNITVRLDGGGFLATPTAISKADVAKENLIVVDDGGKVIRGTRKAFSEVALHLFIYRQRPDVRAVIHSHSPYATALSVAGVEVLPTMLAEPVVSLGDRIPLVPYAKPKSPESTLNMQPFLADYDALVLERHGVMAYGSDLETAYLRMELVEHLARIQSIAAQAGGIREIPSEDTQALLAARTKAGLGSAGRQKSTNPASKAQTSPSNAEPSVQGVIRDEIRRALQD
jgi:L-fuculose-phosphate aldolase